MEVICINDGELPSDLCCPDDAPEWEVKEGEIYNVIDSFINDGYCWYVIEEDPFHEYEDTQWGHESSRFASLSNTQSAVEEAVKIIEVTPHEIIADKPKKWYQKIFS